MDFRLRKLDWYIIRKFVATFFIAIFLIIGIIIIFDISERIDDFVANQAPLKAIILQYYANFVPSYLNMFSPLFVFITVIFFTSRMAANSEIVAILSCGISFHRMVYPYMLSAFLIAMLSLGLNLWVIPRSDEVRLRFENQYIKARKVQADRNIHYQLSPGQFVTVESFGSWNNTAYNMVLETIEDNKLKSRISAQSAVWDSTSRSWSLKNYVIREFTDGLLADEVRTGTAIDTTLLLTIEDFYRKNNTVKQLPYGQLQELIDTQKMRGDANVKFSLIEKYQRFALPLSAFILTLMGVALSSRKKRGGIGWNLAAGIALSFIYILFMRFSEMFVYTGSLPPAVAMWLPDAVFAIIAAVLYKIAPK